MAGGKRRSSSDQLDSKKALDSSVNQDFPMKIFMNGKLRTFIVAKAKALGVLPTMILPSLLSSIANTMNMSQFELRKGWTTQSNIYVLCVANKGAGKTPASKVFMDALVELEKEEKKQFDRSGGFEDELTEAEEDKDDETEEDKDDETEEDKDDETGTPGEESIQTKRTRKRKRNSSYNDEHKEETEGEIEKSMFHYKQRVVDSVTPEALFLSLFYGRGILLISSDEFKGFYDKYILAAQNGSALCSAYSGEPVNYTTVKRGGLTIYKSSLSIFGAIQPHPLMEIINGFGNSPVDYQGLWDRFILIPAAEDPDYDFDIVVEDMDEKDDFDVGKFLSIINKQHSESRTYKCSANALQEVKEVKKKLKSIDEQSNFGNDTRGMTSKAFTNLLKLSPIYACGRQVVQLMEDGSEKMIDFEVSGDDVKAAWELISISMSTYQKFKISIASELGEGVAKDADQDADRTDNLLNYENIDENVVIKGLTKLDKIYKKAVDGKMRISILKRDNLFPRGEGLNMDVFIQALEKFKIGKKEEVKANNKVVTEYLVLTMNTEDPDVLRVFQLLWERAKDLGMVFDPLRKFE